MKTRIFAACGVLIISALLATSSAMSQVSVGIGVTFGPPPPPHEVVVAAPFPDAVWIRGHWAWDDYSGRYVWANGYWVHERPYYTWVDGGWHHGPRGWAWREGRWRHRDHAKEERHERHGEGHGRGGHHR